jgi:hypothetical protein
MSRERSPKRARGRARAIGAVPVQGRPAGFPLGAAVAALVLVAGAAIAPHVRRAWGRLAPRGKPRSAEVSVENSVHAKEADELGRAENEGMPPVFLEGT